MRTILQRTAMVAGCTTIAMVLARAETVMADPRLEEIQALVAELRNCDPGVPAAVFAALQEVADRLETLPGVVKAPNECWRRWKARPNERRANSERPIGPYLTPARNKFTRPACIEHERGRRV